MNRWPYPGEPTGPIGVRKCVVCGCDWQLYVLETNPEQDWCDESGCRCHSDAFGEGWWASKRGAA